jgi:hypothetical protein
LADELLIRTREYLRPQFEDADSLDIIVRVYANLEGMANYLVRQDKVRNLGQLRAFSTGFCGRISSFDFVDVGVGKEGGAARKVRGMCPLCVHVMTGIDLHYPREPFILHFQHTPAARHCSLFRRRATLLTNIDTTCCRKAMLFAFLFLDPIHHDMKTATCIVDKEICNLKFSLEKMPMIPI